ncbi:MAG: hypothetical protein AB1805_15655 [Nitrospirota bacterium]
MLKEKVFDSVVNGESRIAVDRSRCLRMRFNECSCSRCSEQCRSGALVIGDALRVKERACTGCMLCAAACPSDCFTVTGLDFYSLVNRLRKIPVPVLGCKARPDLPAHERTFCMGFLSEEHLIALAVFMKAPLQINLTGCAACGNGFIRAALKGRLQAVRERTSLVLMDKIVLVGDAALLEYREVSYDRRGFFRALRDLTFVHAAGLFEEEAAGGSEQAYSAKAVPLKREMLNRAVGVLPEEHAREVLNAYYYSVLIGDSCTKCFACVGMCPTGALRSASGRPGPALIFTSALCSGCGLCEAFCSCGALHVARGFNRRGTSAPGETGS